MDKDRIEGPVKEGAGKVEEAWGRATNDPDAEAKGEPFDAVVVNRSAGGLCLETDRPIDATTIVSIRVINAPVTVPWIEVQIRSCRQEDSTWLLGCQFVKPPPWSIMLLFG